ncbi:MAG TPA: hypothetical protein VGL76_11050 [Gaiellaceae bacterium]
MRFRSLILLALFGTCLAVPAAFADGDPASDYLITQQIFLPLAVPYSTADGGALTNMLNDAKTKNFPLKVAVISRRDDLGSVPSLYGQPQSYASFLAQEDYNFWKNELLVVMPQGYGLSKVKGLPAADKAVVAKLTPPRVTSGDGLIAAAERAVQALAARRGLKLSTESTSASAENHDRVEIAVGVLVLAALGFGVRMVVRRR